MNLRPPYDCGVHDAEWLSLRSAAQRTKSSLGTIKRWQREGMPTRLHDGRKEVELEVLLAWWRARLAASPVHYYRRRARARAEGRPDPTPPPRAEKPPAEPTQPKLEPSAPGLTWADLTKTMALKRGAAEYRRLQDALRDQVPACSGRPVFTGVKPGDVAEGMMRSLCASCPVLDLCEAFATTARPAGFWAGLWRP